MKIGQVLDGRDGQLVRVARGDLGELGLDGLGDVDRVGVGGLGDRQASATGLPLVRPKPVVATASISTVPRSPRVIGVGRGRSGAACRRRAGAPGRSAAACAVADDQVLDLLDGGEAADRRDRDLATRRPESWPDGKVRLLACRTPTICCVEMPDAASLAGSSVTAGAPRGHRSGRPWRRRRCRRSPGRSPSGRSSRRPRGRPRSWPRSTR